MSDVPKLDREAAQQIADCNYPEADKVGDSDAELARKAAQRKELNMQLTIDPKDTEPIKKQKIELKRQFEETKRKCLEALANTNMETRKSEATKKGSIIGGVLGTLFLIVLAEALYSRKKLQTKKSKRVRMTIYAILGIIALVIVLYHVIATVGTETTATIAQ